MFISPLGLFWIGVAAGAVATFGLMVIIAAITAKK